MRRQQEPISKLGAVNTENDYWKPFPYNCKASFNQELVSAETTPSQSHVLLNFAGTRGQDTREVETQSISVTAKGYLFSGASCQEHKSWKIGLFQESRRNPTKGGQQPPRWESKDP